MSEHRLVLRSRRVVTPGGVLPACIRIRAGTIEAVIGHDEPGGSTHLTDVGDDVIMPGLVDTHVHINEPGRTEWEGFQTATLAAAAGGVTTLVDMPLNNVPATTNVSALDAKRDAARGRCHVDVAFWGGLVPGNTPQLESLVNAGALGFKCFLVPSGVPEFESVGEADLRAALPVLAELGVPLLVHAELPEPIAAAAPPRSSDARAYATYLTSRPAHAEVAAVELLVRLCRETGAHIHIVHVAAAAALPLLHAARQEGLPVTAETCPHYLHFAAEEVFDGATELKCAPPIRGRDNRERLWAALAAGDLDMVVTDHSPCPPDRKLRGSGDFLRAWGGIASLQIGLSVVWSGARARGFGLVDVAHWMAAAPARLAGLAAAKGAIVPGHDADLVVWRPEVDCIVEPALLHHRHALTPYAGQTLAGVVETTYLRGEKIYERGAAVGPYRGRLLAEEKLPWTSHS
jgi:allantoinase